MTTQHTTASGAADRVNAYLDRRATMRSIDPEVVHGIDGPDFELTVSDLRALAASAPVAPTQQGEYPGLPQGDVNTGVGEMWNRHSMRAYVDDDRAARGAAQAASAVTAQGQYYDAHFATPAAPAPASGEPETCKCCGEGSARIVVRRECDTCTSVYSGVAEHRLQKSLAAPPAQEARVPLSDAEALAIVRSVPALLTAEDEWLWAIREVEKYHGIGITAAQKETP